MHIKLTSSSLKPRALVLYIVLVVALYVGVTILDQSAFIATVAIELFYIYCALSAGTVRRVSGAWAVAGSFILIIVYLAYRVGAESLSPYDFVRAVNCWLILAAFSLVPDRLVWDSEKAARLFKIVLIIYFFGYVSAVVLFSESRPKLIIENNFEIPFVVTIYVAMLLSRSINFMSVWTVMMASVVGLSLSRSGIAEFVLAVVLLHSFRAIQPTRIRAPKVMAAIGLGVVGVVAVLAVFVDRHRGAGLADVDRIIMLKALLTAMKDGSWVGWIIGHGPAGVLPSHACESVHYYYLELAGKNGECFAVVLHAFIYRIIYDFGLLGFIGYVGVFFHVVCRRYSRRDAAVLLAPVFLAGLSVGGFYDALSTLGLLFAYIVKPPRRPCAQVEYGHGTTRRDSSSQFLIRCTGPDFSGHEFGVKSYLKKGP